MSSARDFDDWRDARRSRNYRADDPMPELGLAARTHAKTKARTGMWPADFLHIVKLSYGGQIPERFERLARVVAAELAESRRRRATLDSLPPVSFTTIVFPDGSTISTTELST